MYPHCKLIEPKPSEHTAPGIKQKPGNIIKLKGGDGEKETFTFKMAPSKRTCVAPQISLNPCASNNN